MRLKEYLKFIVMQIDLTKINIDKYIDWYFSLTIEAELIPVIKSKIQRYAVASYALHTRYLLNNSNERSLQLHELFMAELKRYEKRLDNIAAFDEPKIRKQLLLPTLEDWKVIKYYRECFMESSITEYQEKVNGTVLTEFDFAQRELKKIEDEEQISFLDHYLERSQLPNTEGAILSFSMDINRIDYAKYLNDRITSLGALPEERNILKWIGKSAQLGYIIGELVQKGYIEAPTLKNGEINYTELAKQVMDSFNAGTTPATLAKALNPNSESGQISDTAKNQFRVPHIKQIS